MFFGLFGPCGCGWGGGTNEGIKTLFLASNSNEATKEQDKRPNVCHGSHHTPQLLCNKNVYFGDDNRQTYKCPYDDVNREDNE